MKTATLIRAALAGLVLTLTGCANLAQFAPPQESVSELVHEHQYAEALRALDRIPPADARYAAAQAQRAQIKAQMRRYKDAQIKKVREQWSQGLLADALATLDKARAQLPTDKSLQVLHNKIVVARNRELAELDQRITLAHAKYLLAQRRIYRQRIRLRSPSYAARLRADWLDEELQRLYGPLLDCGRERLARKELDLAGQCLNAARQISDTPAVRQALVHWGQLREREHAQTEARLDRERHAIRRETLRRRQQLFRDELNKALAEGDLQAARTALNQLRKLQDNSTDLNRVAAAVNQAIAAKVRALLSTGAQLYRQGNFAAARDTWKAALDLDPGNADAQARVQRAERVLRRLQRLQNNEKTTPTAPTAPR